MTDGLINAMLSGKQLKVVFYNVNKQPVTVTMPLAALPNQLRHNQELTHLTNSPARRPMPTSTGWCPSICRWMG